MNTLNQISFKNRVPKHIMLKAINVLSLSNTGKQSPRRIQTRYGLRYVFNIGIRYRLLSTDKSNWKLLSHESYNHYS